MSIDATQSDTHQAIVWLMARISEKEAQLNRLEQRLGDLQNRYEYLEQDNQALRQQLTVLSTQFGVNMPGPTNNTNSLPTTPIDDQLCRQNNTPIASTQHQPAAMPLPHNAMALPMPLQPAHINSSPHAQDQRHNGQHTTDTIQTNPNILQSVQNLSRVELPTAIPIENLPKTTSAPTPWRKYGLDKNAYILIRDYLRGTLRQVLKDDGEINGCRFHATARLGDSINIEFRQAVSQHILTLGELTGIDLSMNTVGKRVAVYLQNYKSESKKTPSELIRDRHNKRLRSQQRRKEAKRQ
ncbi:hypothetical protein BDF19DRAFT_421839 [Syncephalis fuscata]|nr:hypothetical protein BDF19DRAFT_421839 [Syncephalis fuscata]